jgi:hypothetical protein
MLNVRKLMTGTLAATTIAVLAASAAADAPKVSVAAAQPAFKRASFKLATKPPLSVSSDQMTKVRSTLQKAQADFVKDKNALKLMNAGNALGPETGAVYRSHAAVALGTKSQYQAVGSGPQLQSIPPTYAIESGEVIAATSSSPCAGDIQLEIKIKNVGQSLVNIGPRMFLSVWRASDPTFIITSAFVNIPTLAAQATATIQTMPLKHRATNGGSCTSGDIFVAPTFVKVNAASDYRIKVSLTDTNADATLLSGLFMANTGNSSSGSGGGGNDCSVGIKCPSGACATFCPPCPDGFKESGGGCYVDDNGSIVFR